ncbi:flagellar basal body rod protein FlgB [Paraperlucidibaca wandonensis]|jgi:flagellar basal-body rod protein FlgB|uniref:Flagellar basal body rod protein FlgB n=1 Tax=Paraperlucidibaca wandonensis TaxID=1268273 RepID=A0ABW3HE10_9GAMM|nr:flagellar basal body rod protein FlgB [Paraperlucidibaca sp.]MBQ0841331.1 flagellar basal body rod protein FlgB [Paraperlucidibaca sp.]|tara:strand:- start:172 stop:651 length:480 start_codon:yes stop_codon:yes gene_type:complete
MGISFDSVLGVHEKALHLRAMRSEVLASNIANADTPGYQARDFDFKAALAGAMGESAANANNSRMSVGNVSQNTNNLGLSVSSSGTSINQAGANVSASSSSSAESLKYRIPLQSSIDGNTVEAEREQAAFADNTVRYQATLQFLGGKFSSMKTAITGGR